MTNGDAIAFIQRAREVLACEIKEKVDPLDKQLMTEHKYCIPNLEKNANLLEWAGINFGEGYAVFL